MVELRPDLDRVFQALSDGTRRAMIAQLCGGERSVGDLAMPFAMSLAGASKHVRVLEDAGIIQRRRKGRVHYCSLQPARLAAAEEWLRRYQQFWTGQLDQLETVLADADVPKDGSNHQ